VFNAQQPALHENFEHDPIKAVLNISGQVPPSYHLIDYNMNNSKSELITKYMDSFPNQCILQNKDSKVQYVQLKCNVALAHTSRFARNWIIAD